MGYLSQKKSQIRKDVFFMSTSLVCASLTLLALLINNFGYSFFNLFHIYLISFLLIILALACGRFKIAFWFLVLFLINYIHLSSTANIFISSSLDGGKIVDLSYGKNIKLRDLTEDNIIKSGDIILSADNYAQYVTTKDDITVVSFDFDNLTNDSFKTSLNNLHKFIVKQNNRIIVLGYFGKPIWNRDIAKFIEASGLKAKNKLLFTKNSRFNIFTYPTFYVLGFDNIGIKEIKIDENKNINLQISFNPFNI